MAKLNRTCSVCKKNYSYCPTCAADLNKPTWMAMFCSKNCREIYNTSVDYKREILSRENAFDILNGLDLSYMDKLPENFKVVLNEILKTDDEVKEEKIEEIIIDNNIVSEMVVEEPYEKEEVEKETIKEQTMNNNGVFKNEFVKGEHPKNKKKNYNKRPIEKVDNE